MLTIKAIFTKNVDGQEHDLGHTIFLVGLALAPLCFLSVRGWTNAFLFLLFLVAVWQLIHKNAPLIQHKTQATTTQKWVIFTLASPLVAVILGQLFRGRPQLDLMDGPARSFLAVWIFLYLLRKNIDFVKILEWCIPASLIGLGFCLWKNPYAYVSMPNQRFGTTAVDPLTLGQYASLFGFICLFSSGFNKNNAFALKFIKIIGFFIALWVSINAGSRSAWVAFPVILLLWLFQFRKKFSTRNIIFLFFLITLMFFAIYNFSPLVNFRIDLAIGEIKNYFSDQRHDSSTGLRISLARVATFLFLENPIDGYGDIRYPALSSIPSIASFNTELLESTLIHNGVHNEILQNALRSGIFGLISSVMMFVVPFVVFLRGSSSPITSVRAAAVVGLCYIVSVFCFSLSTETFNLKYTMSFYALMVSALAAQVLRPQPV